MTVTIGHRREEYISVFPDRCRHGDIPEKLTAKYGDLATLAAGRDGSSERALMVAAASPPRD
jgi:hypothetical protein